MYLWVTDTSNGSRKLGSRPANPMPQLFVFVASCLSNQFALPGTLLRQSWEENATDARYLMQCWVKYRKDVISPNITVDPK